MPAWKPTFVLLPEDSASSSTPEWLWSCSAWFVFISFEAVNLCLESHLGLTGGGLQLREMGLGATGSAISQHRQEGFAVQPAIGYTPGRTGFEVRRS